MRVDRWNVHRDGPLSEEALERKLAASCGKPTRHTYPPACYVALPADGAERWLALASGLIKVTIDRESVILAAGDILAIPAGSATRLEALGPLGSTCFQVRRVG